jgi:hypothetical protein
MMMMMMMMMITCKKYHAQTQTDEEWTWNGWFLRYEHPIAESKQLREKCDHEQVDYCLPQELEWFSWWERHSTQQAGWKPFAFWSSLIRIWACASVRHIRRFPSCLKSSAGGASWSSYEHNLAHRLISAIFRVLNVTRNTDSYLWFIPFRFSV